MKFRYRDPHFWIRISWILALTSIAVWSAIPSYRMGWDFMNFRDAIVSLRSGHDPYSDALAKQTDYFNHLAAHPDAPAPLSYDYSPATLPLLRQVGRVPFHVSGTIYWLLYGIGFVFILRLGLEWVDDEERKVFAYLVPIAIFFPGLLQSDVLFSGNVAILLYGCVLAAAVVGWRKENWLWFYAAILLASLFKTPMLSLLAIPVLSSRKQWFSASIAALAGVGMFCAQPLLWPGLFASYMKILDCMFRMQQDFSGSPTGLLTQLFYGTLPYRATMAAAYLAYAVPVACILLYLARRYFAGRLTLQQWCPVMLIGVILLNPRIVEYDVAILSLPMALVLWRAFAKDGTMRATILKVASLLIAANLLTLVNLPIVHLAWRCVECTLLLAVFATGANSLYVLSRQEDACVEDAISEVGMDNGFVVEKAF